MFLFEQSEELGVGGPRVSEAVNGNGKTAVFQGKIKTENGRFF